jgi:hypothetical protein
MEHFELTLRISISDTEVRRLLGPVNFEKLFDEGLDKTRGSCGGCGYKPLDDSKTKSIISFHVINFNPDSHEETTGVPLCKACHTTQHIDVAIEKDWIELVNSTHAQKTLIELCRINAVHNNVNYENTRKLKTTPKEFLEKIKLGTIFPSSKTKVLLTSNFIWGDL